MVLRPRGVAEPGEGFGEREVRVRRRAQAQHFGKDLDRLGVAVEPQQDAAAGVEECGLTRVPDKHGFDHRECRGGIGTARAGTEGGGEVVGNHRIDRQSGVGVAEMSAGFVIAPPQRSLDAIEQSGRTGGSLRMQSRLQFFNEARQTAPVMEASDQFIGEAEIGRGRAERGGDAGNPFGGAAAVGLAQIAGGARVDDGSERDDLIAYRHGACPGAADGGLAREREVLADLDQRVGGCVRAIGKPQSRGEQVGGCVAGVSGRREDLQLPGDGFLPAERGTGLEQHDAGFAVVRFESDRAFRPQDGFGELPVLHGCPRTMDQLAGSGPADAKACENHGGRNQGRQGR